MTGRVVLLHGTSSSGKTTVARAVQALSDEPWLRLGIDAFWTAIDERWMEHGPRASEGFLWREDARIVPGPVGEQLAAGMCRDCSVRPLRQSPARGRRLHRSAVARQVARRTLVSSRYLSGCSRRCTSLKRGRDQRQQDHG